MLLIFSHRSLLLRYIMAMVVVVGREGGGAHGRLGLMLRNTVLYLRIVHSGSHIVAG